MVNKLLTTILILFCIGFSAGAGARQCTVLKNGWHFAKGHGKDITQWKEVRIPHDWAISGPFDRKHDLQVVAVEQNGETEPSCKTGRTGGLPFIGKGTYKTSFDIPDTTGRVITLLFDGVMSNSHVYVNGREVTEWPYGYNSFFVTLDSKDIHNGINDLMVECENKEEQSRWYPGAGIYRNVHLINTSRIHIPVWGTHVTTPCVSDSLASVRLSVKIDGAEYRQNIEVRTTISDNEGNCVAKSVKTHCFRGQDFVQNFSIENPRLWSPATPAVYTAHTVLAVGGKVIDNYDTRFGIRKIDYIPHKGFFLNGKTIKFKGVCIHHDLGPLGAAINRSAVRHRLALLKDMGCNAIRTSHNMPSPELVELCDEMGIMLMIEPFDDWGFRPKSPNGYGTFFNQWAEKDVANMVIHYRNSPSVVMWSIGNEVPSQWGEPGIEEVKLLSSVVHRFDQTRPITCGMEQIGPGAVIDNGFAASLDIPGFNYKPEYYLDFHNRLPNGLVFGSETASAISSRGRYYFPVKFGLHHCEIHPDNHNNSYDNESVPWGNTADLDFAMDEDHEFVIGQFVWTGFDYLGEPTPYDTDAWPSHSSVFGIIDLASIPKDRYYLYRANWNKEDATLHILPHWNWRGREGKTTPVFVYSSYPKAELFINGKSQGIREKNDSTLQNRYRLMWNETVYEPGEIKVVAYDSLGNKADEKVVRTAGKPHHLVLTSNTYSLSANEDDLAFITVQVADKDGNIVPDDNRKVRFSVSGAGSFEATANGDPTSLLPFQNPEMALFSGGATAIVRSGDEEGILRFTASANGVKSSTITIYVK